MVLAHADYALKLGVVHIDWGGEKFIHIKCHQLGLATDAIVLAVIVRALKVNGDMKLNSVTYPDSRRP